VSYHDGEWGRPVVDERGLFEKLCLEAFQSGLSWLTILRKREAFRDAFDGFDIEAVSRYGARDVKRLLGNAAIVRNRAKIDATVANARVAAQLGEEGQPLSELIWSFAPKRSRTPRGRSKELKRRGFRFVGPTTAYALMQACGIVNDHLSGCAVREQVEAARQVKLS
jgi:DNA-3-methyladenine glycosylase I